jgi:Flp pilus assembly protein TadG
MHLFPKPHNEHGAAAVEIALVLPILILLIGGIIDFGFAFNTMVSLTHAAREGVRVEAIGNGDEGASAEAVSTAQTAFLAPAATFKEAKLEELCSDGDRAKIVVTADAEVFFLSLILSDPIPLKGQAVMRCGA